MISISGQSSVKPVALVFGTRPEAIKLAPVARALEKAGIPYRILVTAQHRELLDQMLSVFELRADVDLNLMKQNQLLSGFGSRALAAMGRLFRDERPSVVVVQGDTSTVFFSALAAFYEKIPVAHVEAGLRSFNMNHPFPEEANRSLTARLASFHFAPTARARDNLLNEGVDDSRIYVTGNTVIDSLRYIADNLSSGTVAVSDKIGTILDRCSGTGPLVLLTAHRRENFGRPMENIFEAVKTLCSQRRDLNVIYPVHPNPNVMDMAYRHLGKTENIHLVAPLSYVDFVAVMKAVTLCLTDSGGVQEEAPGLGVPVVVLRETTERPEGVKAGCAVLVGSDKERIISTVTSLISQNRIVSAVNPYGDGTAGRQIVSILSQKLSLV